MTRIQKYTWQIKKLSEICKKASSNISQNQLVDNYGDYPIYGAGGFLKKVNFYHQDKEYIGVIKDGAWVGRISLLPAKSSVIGTLQYILPQDWIDIKFLYYSLLSVDFLKHKQGSTIPHIYFKDYSEEKIVALPLPEQLRLVSILDQAFVWLDQARKNAEKNLQNAKDIFESYLQNIILNSGKDWEEKRLGELCVKITKGSSPNWQWIKYVEEPGILFVTSENVGRNKLILAKKKYVEEKFNVSDKKSILEQGDVLTNIVWASIGRTAIFSLNDSANINQAVCMLRCKKEILNNIYLTYILNSPFFQKILHDNEVDNARANLSLSFFNNLAIPVPDLSKQLSIVSQLDTLSTETKRLETIYKRKLACIDELKKSLLKKAFSGDL